MPRPIRNRVQIKTGQRAIAAGGKMTDNVNVTGDRSIVVVVNGSATKDDIMAALEPRLRDSAEDGLIPLRRQVELFALARNLSSNEEQLFAAYAESLPAQADVVDSKDLWDLISDLSDRSLEPTKQPPIFAFVEQLSRLTGNVELKRDLEKWIIQSAEALSLPVRFVSSSGPAAGQVDAFLQVELLPDANNPNRTKEKLYTAEISLWRTDTGPCPAFHSAVGSTPMPMEDVPVLLDKILSDPNNARHVPSMKDLAFEFILPFELLSYTVDRWPRNKSSTYIYGQFHPLVVRSLDRLAFCASDPLEGRISLEYWSSKWRALHAPDAEPTWAKLRWLAEKEQADCDRLIRNLQDDDGISCLGLSAPPTVPLVNVFFRAGIPVVLWVRETRDASGKPWKLPAHITKILKSGTLASLPAALRMIRRHAQDESAYPDNWLTLLWDDPTRIPKKYLTEGAYSDEQLASF